MKRLGLWLSVLQLVSLGSLLVTLGIEFVTTWRAQKTLNAAHEVFRRASAVEEKVMLLKAAYECELAEARAANEESRAILEKARAIRGGGQL